MGEMINTFPEGRRALEEYVARHSTPESRQSILSSIENALPQPRQSILPEEADKRKEYPIVTGFLDYFPDAVAAVAHVSWKGNQQHNPGQPTHWARDKSFDHADCIGRHLLQRDTRDVDGEEHLTKNAWRAMALLQVYLEKKYN